MNDEQEQATDSAPIEDWVVCPKCLKEVPMHRAHYCVRVTITTPEYEVTPERLVELLHDARSKTKEANRRDFESSAELAALAKECEELRKDSERLHWLHDCSTGVTDLEGYEWGIYRVKWNCAGQVESIYATDSNFNDLDKEMAREAAARADAARKEPPAKAHGCEVGE
jgi:hypothetical protein